MITIKDMNEQERMNVSQLHRRVDFHSHSNFSDGALTPTALLSLASEQNIELFSLTDHDTIAGLDEAREAAKIYNINLVSGVEISTLWKGIPIHLVALNFPQSHAELLTVLDNNQSIRIDRAKKIALLLMKQGLPDLFDKAMEEAGRSQIGRPHFARVMVNQNLVKDSNKAFDRYLGNKRLGQLRDVWPDLESVTTALKGGDMELVLAHPKRYPITMTKLKKLVYDFVEYGGTSLEVSSGNDKPENVRLLEGLIKEHKIKASVGSDFHGPYGPWCQVGKFSSFDEARIPTVWQDW
ncbi:PHP domain-containing protein [Marinomonas sp. 15G1-11]|uniref:PHP domain-containing protein n=1 Tax=Marinomonas phaeophyticola TaxID=3004091 RepID=A0ABT4JRC6_9GAMM|nr:PHP domain-containing protein [Marinomonas sp. 15G1-11]MCZ2720572.1 PHP domain-containing protein [Marinomonas sp. 15G1-11]